MGTTPKNKARFKLISVLLVVCVSLAIIVVAYIVFVTQANKSTTITQGDTVTLVGKITSTDCPGGPDTGCSIIVNGYSVQIVHGFTNTPDLGTVTGYAQNQPLVNKTAHIYAQKIDDKDASIFGNSRYYVHISE